MDNLNMPKGLFGPRQVAWNASNTHFPDDLWWTFFI